MPMPPYHPSAIALLLQELTHPRAPYVAYVPTCTICSFKCRHNLRLHTCSKLLISEAMSHLDDKHLRMCLSSACLTRVAQLLLHSAWMETSYTYHAHIGTQQASPIEQEPIVAPGEV